MHSAINSVPITQAIKQAIIAIALANVLLAIVATPFIAAGLAIWGY